MRKVKIGRCANKFAWGRIGTVIGEYKLNNIDRLLVSVDDWWLIVDKVYTEDYA